MNHHRLISLTLLSFSLLTTAGAATSYKADSPDGRIILNVSLDNDNHVRYSMYADGREIISPSLTGLRLNSADLSIFNNGITATLSTGNDTYTAFHGKKSLHDGDFNEMTVTGTSTNKSRNLRIRFRLYNDALAMRYELDNRQGYSVTEDRTEFRFSGFESSHAQKYHSDYSWYYEQRTWSAMTDQEGYNTPVLIDCGSGMNVLLCEASSGSMAAMAASRVFPGDKQGMLKLKVAGNSAINSSAFISPWRVLITGSLRDIVESTRVSDLNTPCIDSDFSWVRPGRVAWNWGAEDGDSSPDMQQVKRYIDLACHMEWEYFLLDDGWDGRIDLNEVTDAARDKNVGVLLWTHHNRFDGSYSQAHDILSAWASCGIKGIKADFFEDDRQEMMSKYENILRAAADLKMLVNFHGCTRPTGFERTWPNLMTSEAVLGGEFYMFNSTMTPASHMVNLALTRNVLGSMDYTPVKFGDKKGRAILNTTWSCQLALSVAFESSLQSICDTPENLIGSIAEPFLRMLPTTWDDTKCLEALPDKYITIARRKGEDWWLATLSSEKRELDIPLDFLPKGRTFYAYVYSEGFHRSDIAFERLEVNASDKIHLSIGADSGAAVILSEDPSLPSPFTVKLEAERYNRYCERVDNADCSGGIYLSGIGGQRKKILMTDVEVPEDGDYHITLHFIDAEPHSAYICVNNGDKTYHDFPGTGGRLYFKTFTVKLLKGKNTIEIGNETSTAPGFDRIVVTRIINAESGSSSVADTTLEPEVKITGMKDGTIRLSLPETSSVSIYLADGIRLSSAMLPAGEYSMICPVKGLLIVNVNSGKSSLSKKIRI